MAGDPILEYVKQQRAAGYADEAIRAALVKAGWRQDAIESAMRPIPFVAPEAPAAGPQAAQAAATQRNMSEPVAWNETPLMRSYEIPWNQPAVKQAGNVKKRLLFSVRRVVRAILVVMLLVAVAALAYIEADRFLPEYTARLNEILGLYL